MIRLSEGGRSPYRIVMAHPAHETVKFACDEFHDFFYQMTGASLPVTTELQAANGPEILIGNSARVKAAGVELAEETLGPEGFCIRTLGENLLLAGATPRGTLYAVYAFLEEDLGCRWYASDVGFVPRRLTVSLPALDRTDKPAFESREAYWRDAFDGAYASRNRLNGNKADIGVRRGGHQKWYNFHHSFDDLVPTRVYYAEHPEYYSLVDGKRLSERNQLCLTHPDVLRIAERTLRGWIRDNPDCTVFSIAQNDWDNHCTCPECLAMETAEGSPSGPVLWFVNQLADAVARDHPSVLLHTFAYQYTRKAPKHLRPRPNVIVRLCDIECCFSHPLDGSLPEGVTPKHAQSGPRQCGTETPFLRDLAEWSGLCSRLYVWDYVTDFTNYLMPFPNFAVLQRNLQLFKRYGVAGVLEQGAFAHGGGAHFAELQAYVQAKLLWNPDADLWAHVDDFLTGFYGAEAAPPLRRYIGLWQDAVVPWHTGINERANAPYVTEELLLESERLLCQALFLTRDPDRRKRLERLQLGLTYMLLSRMPVDTPGRNALIERFGWQCRAQGISELHERWPLEDALESLKETVGGPGPRRAPVCDYKM